MPAEVPIGISVDGAEGPGAYGLNRHVALTVLVGQGGKVSANFALVQPSVQADAPKILAKVAELIGEKPPSAEELQSLSQASGQMQAARPSSTDPRLAELLRSVIRKDATPEQVERAAEAVEAFVSKDDRARVQLRQITRRIVDSGRLANYGTRSRSEIPTPVGRRVGSPGETAEEARPDSQGKPARNDQ